MQNLELFSTNGLKHHRAWIAGIFGAALLVRLAILAFTFPGNEAVYYYDDAKIALNLIEGKGYSISYEYRNWLFYEAVLKTAKLEDPIMEGTRTTAVKQPAYPLLLAGLFYCFGAKNFFAVFLLHSVLASLTVTMLFLLLRRHSPLGALAVASGTALYPPFAFHSVATPESTTLLLFLIVALWLCLVKTSQRASLGWWSMCGALGGLAVLTEPVTLPFIGLSLFYALYLDRRALRTRLAGLALAIGVSVLLVSPWLARNYLVFHRFPVFKSGLGLVFNWGLHFSGKGSWITDERMVALEKAGRNLSELEEDEAIRKEVISRFPSHWREYIVQDIPRHFLHLWWDVPRYWNNYSLGYLLGRRVPYLVLLGLALPGLIRTAARLVRQPRDTLQNHVVDVSALMLIVTCTALYSLFGAFHSRYRLPVELGCFIFAASTLRPVAEAVWNKWSRRIDESRLSAVGLVAPRA